MTIRRLLQIGLLGSVAALCLAIPVGFAISQPVPIGPLLLFSLIVLTANVGGQFAGCLAGLMGGAAILYCYKHGYGPPPLTGSLFHALAGSGLFVLTGFLAGRTKSQHDETLVALQRTQSELEDLLKQETAETDIARQSLRAHVQRLDQAAQIAQLGYFVFDVERGICEFCSERHAAIFGLTSQEFMSRLTGLTGPLRMMHQDDAAEVRKNYTRLKNGEDIQMEYRFIRADGSIGYIREFVTPKLDESGKVVRGIGSSLDISRQKETELRERQSHKLETVGHLTAGVAHDFNNLLAVIMGNAELIELSETDQDTIDSAEQIIRACERGSALTKSLLSFAQQSMMRMELFAPADAIRSVDTMFRRTLLNNVPVNVSIDADVGMVRLDRDLLENALLNLLINARDATFSGCRIDVCCQAVTFENGEVRLRHLSLAPGNYCRITVRDNGSGISPANLKRVTDPFFTTKNRAEGSGLGLSMVQGFVRQSQGALDITSSAEDGTKVDLYFPTYVAEPDVQTEHAIATPPLSSLRVLLVEDDTSVRRVILRLLQSVDLVPEVATNGAQALDMLSGDDGFDIVILDNIMPGSLRGVDVARRLHSDGNRAGIIMLTGDATAQSAVEDGHADAWLRKPVAIADLVAALHGVDAHTAS